jgi:hypothetical protein
LSRWRYCQDPITRSFRGFAGRVQCHGYYFPPHGSTEFAHSAVTSTFKLPSPTSNLNGQRLSLSSKEKRMNNRSLKRQCHPDAAKVQIDMQYHAAFRTWTPAQPAKNLATARFVSRHFFKNKIVPALDFRACKLSVISKLASRSHCCFDLFTDWSFPYSSWLFVVAHV